MERDLSNENMIHVKKDGIEYLQFRKLLEFEDLVNCFTLKTGNLNFRKKPVKNWLYKVFKKYVMC